MELLNIKYELFGYCMHSIFAKRAKLKTLGYKVTSQICGIIKHKLFRLKRAKNYSVIVNPPFFSKRTKLKTWKYVQIFELVNNSLRFVKLLNANYFDKSVQN